MTCKPFVGKNYFTSSVTQETFLFSISGTYSCKSYDIIYLITCAECDIQYVGLTEQNLHERMNGHRASLKAGKNLYIYQHFNQEGHNFSNATVQIIDYIDSTTVTDIKKALSDSELFWINILSTAFPLGLNDNIKGAGNISQSFIIEIYFKAKILRCKRGHGKKKQLKIERRKNKKYKSKDEIEQVERALRNDFIHNKNIFYQRIKSFQRKQLLQIYNSCGKELGLFFNVLRSYVHTFVPEKSQLPKKETENILFQFSSKALDLVEINSVIKDTRIQSLLPDIIQPFCPLKVYYRYDIPIGRRILNYSSFLKKLDNIQIKAIMNKDCNCSHSPYIYEPHGHVITGNLDIIPDDNLRLLLSYGTKFREPRYLSPLDLLSSLSNDIEEFIKKRSSKYKLQNTEFEEWRNEVKRVLKNKIKFFAEHKPYLFIEKSSILKENNVRSCLEYLRQKYIICSIDKASNNYVFICKKYYLITLMTELGIDFNTLVCTGNGTYQPVNNRNESDIINSHSDIMKNEFNITVSGSNKGIPRIFWNPKLHKTPYKARYIAGSSKCTTKQLSLYVNKALKVVRDYFSRYCNALYKNSGINCNWSINSSTQFVEKLETIDVYNIQVYDFTTLYTNLDLNVVEDLLSKIIDLIFSNTNKYICISKFNDNCFFSKKEYNNYYCFTASLLKKAIHFLLQNTFVSFGEIVLQQTKGIPMGGNSSSQLADLSLAISEFNYMKKLLSEKKINLAKLLSNNCRYVDDISIINYLNFGSLISEIYPSDLAVERSGDDNKHINYLDIKIDIEDSSLKTSVYNKVDDFDFSVVTFTFPNSNIPINVGYNVFYSQLLRYCCICSHLLSFISSTKIIYTILINRHYKQWKLISKFRLFIKNNPQILLKYKISDTREVEKEIFER